MLIGQVTPAHRSQTGSDSADDVTADVGRASRVAVVTSLQPRPTATDATSRAAQPDNGAATNAAAASLSTTDIASNPDLSADPSASASASGAGLADGKPVDAGAARHPHMHAAVHRPVPPVDAMRVGGTLRADIARYNAERRSGGRPAVLRAASVPNVHSLWDEVPGPMSDVYRN
ncbi:hypothetical protein [Robbsia sp. KACC 23696]|uniref:hypothetical protein n=1 Tax=Robbsia sp. KACC 23696 TaxID=3149231 RepID=UPI00325B7558